VEIHLALNTFGFCELISFLFQDSVFRGKFYIKKEDCKDMLDINLLRENPALVKAMLKKTNCSLCHNLLE